MICLKGLKVSKVTLCVQNLKWQSPTDRLTVYPLYILASESCFYALICVKLMRPLREEIKVVVVKLKLSEKAKRGHTLMAYTNNVC